MKKLIFLCVLMAIAGSANAFMLSNGGFETDVEPDGMPDDWGMWQSAWTASHYGWFGPSDIIVNTSPGQAHSGSVSIELRAGDSTGWGYAMMIQEPIAATAGQTYTASFWGMQLDGTGGEGVGIKWEFYSDTATLIEQEDKVMLSAADVWEEVTRSWVAPAGTTWMKYVILATGLEGNYMVDDAVLVPEPMSIAILGLGGLFLRRRK